MLKSRGFFKHDYTLEIDRAHRLGKRRQDENEKPRPIIMRFSFFKYKQQVIQKGKLFKGCEVAASEDYSKATINIHKQLRIEAKAAQSALEVDNEQFNSITHYKVTYRRVVLTYKKKNNPSSPTYTKSFSLDYINSNKKWYLPATCTTYNGVQRQTNLA